MVVAEENVADTGMLHVTWHRLNWLCFFKFSSCGSRCPISIRFVLLCEKFPASGRYKFDAFDNRIRTREHITQKGCTQPN
jgi:hypothetical protein